MEAIKKRIAALKKEAGGKATTSGTPKSKGTATPKATPKKAPMAKTPRSSEKRKRASVPSDEDADMDYGDDDSGAERERLKTTPSGSRSSLSRRLKIAAKTYHEDSDSSGDVADPEDNTDAVTPTPAAGGEEQQNIFAGGAFDGSGETVGQMDGVTTGVAHGVVAGTLTPQGKATNGNGQAKSATKRAVKRKAPVHDSDGSEFTPDFMLD